MHSQQKEEEEVFENNGAVLTKDNRWCLAAATFFILQERHLQAIVLDLWAVALQRRKIAQVVNDSGRGDLNKV
jgi:hypothetical protein